MFISACIIILAILVLIFIILCKVYITLLMITGLSKSVARFQIFSLFTNSGFTTGESELIMYNRLRRKIAAATMITGYVFGTLVTAFVIGVIAGLNFKDGEYALVYWQRILVVLGITIGVLVIFFILTKVPKLRKMSYNFLKKLVAPEAAHKGNPIIYEELVHDKYVAQVELRVLRDAFKENPIGTLNFTDAGITILLVTTKGETEVLSGREMAKHTLQKGDVIQVFGSAKDIENVFSMRK